MVIIDSEITSTSISLSTFSDVDRLLLSYGETLNNSYELTSVGSNDITITNTDLGLDNLDNMYFKLQVWDSALNIANTALYTINIINNKEAELYNANTLKQELDNLNYYDGIIESLTEKESYLEANDMFNNYINFLNNKLNANNLSNIVSGQNDSGSCD